MAPSIPRVYKTFLWGKRGVRKRGLLQIPAEAAEKGRAEYGRSRNIYCWVNGVRYD